MTSSRNTTGAAMATVSRKARMPGEAISTNAVMRMCSPRRRATTAPSIASHRISMEASSSDHTRGACSRKRLTTPASKTMISATTRSAAAISTAWLTAVSTTANVGCRCSIACECCIAAMTSPQLPGVLLEQAPALLAVLRLPVGIEGGLRKGAAEGLAVHVDDGEALGFQIVPQRSGQLGDVGTLLRARTVEFLLYDGAQIVRQFLPGAAVAEDPIAVPDVAGQTDGLLHLVELRRGDDGQGVFLALDNLGLQGGIQFVEVDGCRARAQRREQRGEHGGLGYADLESLQVLRLADLPAGGRHMAEAVVPDLAHRHQPGLADLGPDEAAEFAVHGLPHRVVVREGKTRVDDAGGSGQGGEHRGGLVEELHAATAHLGQEVGIRAQLVCREQLDVHAAVGGLADAVQGFLGTGVDRMGGVLAGGQLVVEFSRVGPA